MKDRFHIDIETYSSNDLKKGGVYKYVKAPDFEVMLIAFALNDGDVEIIDVAEEEPIPDDLINVLQADDVIKVAHNAQFERLCLSKYLKIDLDVRQWDCTMVRAARAGYPLSLNQAGKAIGLDTEKDRAGKALIRYFSLPCKATKKNGKRTRNLPGHAPEKWDQFKAYCKRDVIQEQKIDAALSFFKETKTERKLYELDQAINDRGIALDQALIEKALKADEKRNRELVKEAKELTGLSNPNSTSQLKEWIGKETGETVDTLRKADVEEMIAEQEGAVKRVLQIRQKTSKTSTKKYVAMEDCECEDGKAHGLLQFYGANRTGRWSGRLIQIQNLPRIKMNDEDLRIAREMVMEQPYGTLDLFYSNIPDMLSQLIRTAFVPSKGNRLIVADFSAIELIVVAWIAGEKWVIDEYKGARKIYEGTAARMLGLAVEDIAKDSPERQKGKIASLACQYGGSVGALKSMGAVAMGLKENELPEIIERWRMANPNIVRLWKEFENAAIEAVNNPGKKVWVKKHIGFKMSKGLLIMGLPSGRKLSYVNPILKDGKYGEALTYMNMNQTTKKWERTDTWGGKLVENAVQAVARDLLAEAMLSLDSAGYNIVAHVHDEVILDVHRDFGSLEEVIEIMTKTPDWAEGLPLAADGFESKYYKK